MLLAMYLHKVKATSWSLRTEAVAMLRVLAPPAPGGQTMESDFTTVFVWFVKDYLLRRWTPVFPVSDGNVSRDAADLALLDHAQKQGLPIVTNEGVSAQGIADTKRNNMRRRGLERGVEVFAPREYSDGKMNVAEETDAFFARFRDRAPTYLERRGRRDEMGKTLDWVYGFYLMTLRGEVEGRDTPLSR